MGIDRTPFNALVDDDGSGNIGTVWNKNQIQGVLLDPIDALVSGPWVPYTPTLAIDAGSWSGPNYCRYKKIDKTVFARISLENTTTSAATSKLFVSLPYPAANFDAGVWDFFALYYIPPFEIGYGELGGGASSIAFGRSNGTAFPANAGSLYVRSLVIYETP